MSHHSYLYVGRLSFFWWNSSFDPELAALFSESDRIFTDADEEDGTATYEYRATALQLRQRLQLQGFTATRALADLANGIEQWRLDEADASELDPGPGLAGVADEPSPPDPISFAEGLREMLAVRTEPEEGEVDFDGHRREEELNGTLEKLEEYVPTRSLLRLLLDLTADEVQVGLDLHELIGCCVEMDPEEPVAATARAAQLTAVSANAPVIVLTEGRTDSRFLQMAMSVTHPHLVGFIKFINFDDVHGAEGNVSALAKTTYAFIAAGVANRFVAIADNDTESHAGLANLKREKLPENCRVMHYPPLEMLEKYPTLGPGPETPVIMDVNGLAGSLEMYLGQDSLTVDGALAPVQWRGFNPKLNRYHGTLRDQDKSRVQEAFARKHEEYMKGARSPQADWSGVHAIIEQILRSFE